MQIWDDVQMDPASAQAAAGQLRRTADMLGRLTRARDARAADAVDGWNGAPREHFDDELPRLQGQAGVLIDSLRRAAAQIDEKLQDAHHEQRRREQLRDEHRSQQRPRVR